MDGCVVVVVVFVTAEEMRWVFMKLDESFVNRCRSNLEISLNEKEHIKPRGSVDEILFPTHKQTHTRVLLVILHQIKSNLSCSFPYTLSLTASRSTACLKYCL